MFNVSACWTTHLSRRRHWSRHWSLASPAWVHRPAARRIHLTFDVSTAGCVSYFSNNWDNKHVVSCCQFLKMCCYRYRIVLFSAVAFKTLDISQRSVATHLRCGWTSWFWQWKNFENRLIFGKVRAYKSGANFWATLHVWNSLPEHIRRSTSMAVFKRSVKTFRHQQKLRLRDNIFIVLWAV